MGDLQAKIAQIKEVSPDDLDGQMIEDFERTNDGMRVSWSDYKAKRQAHSYNGSIFLRTPKKLHQEFAESAKGRGVSLS